MITDLKARARERGMSLIEVMVAFAILSISILGLVGGLVVASSANGWAATRTQMSAFAQSRLERIAGQLKGTVCSTVATDIQGQQGCAIMATAPTPFNPDVAAGTGGWMLDLIDWPPPASNGGDDVMYGPLVVLSDSNAVDAAKTIAARSTAVSNWTGSAGTGCDSPQVQGNPAILCREIHIEPFTSTPPDGGVGVGAPMLQIWVRVVRGGTTDWHLGSVTMQEIFAQ